MNAILLLRMFKSLGGGIQYKQTTTKRYNFFFLRRRKKMPRQRCSQTKPRLSDSSPSLAAPPLLHTPMPQRVPDRLLPQLLFLAHRAPIPALLRFAALGSSAGAALDLPVEVLLVCNHFTGAGAEGGLDVGTGEAE